MTAEAAPCEDGEDNDSDGWIDADDPDCTSGSSETGYGTVECNDGTDNDSDGDIDADDVDCLDASDNYEDSYDCADAIDNDGDGWIDLDDPACGSSSTTSTESPSSSAYECNDGSDNDADGDIDSADAGCADGFDNDESDEAITDCTDLLDRRGGPGLRHRRHRAGLRQHGLQRLRRQRL